MKDRLKRILTFTIMLGIFVGISTTGVMADGTETLGVPSIGIAQGSGVIAAGTGLYIQPGTIEINIPAGTKVNQVLLYWEGQQNIISDVNTIRINGELITGNSIGGPTEIPFWYDFFKYSSTYRADITKDIPLVVGLNTLEIKDLNFDFVNNGAGILVIYDNGIFTSNIQLKDGNDFAYSKFEVPHDLKLETTVEQTFTFTAVNYVRTASLSMFFSSVSGTMSGYGFRPSDIVITVGGGIPEHFSDLLDSHDLEEWDTVTIPNVIIPAGVDSLNVQAVSPILEPGDARRPASFTWNAAALSIPLPPAPGTGTPGYWKNHPEAWPVDNIIIGEKMYTKAEAIAIIAAPVKGDKIYTMFPALVSAKLNVLIGNSDSCIAGTIDAADAWMKNNLVGSKVTGSSPAWKIGEPLYIMLDNYNNGLLCAPHRD